jgi:hypothetical protein
LKKICGKDFRTGLSKKTIYLGISAEAKKLLGKDDLSKVLKEQVSVIQTKDGNLFLYGAGAEGNLYAVYELLENQLNRRWLNAYGDSFIPRMKTITLKEGVWRTGYSFSTRALMNYFYPDKLTAYIYNYRNRQKYCTVIFSNQWLVFGEEEKIFSSSSPRFFSPLSETVRGKISGAFSRGQKYQLFLRHNYLFHRDHR